MCIVAAKYLGDKLGWVLMKARDRNYLTSVTMMQSNKKKTQRLYILDETTGWTEGLNEHGISVISASYTVLDDEEEFDNIQKAKKKAQEYFNREGEIVRDSLFFSKIDDTVDYLIKKKLRGATIISDGKKCFLLEGDYTDIETEEYRHELKEIKKTETVVRANHGILLKDAGYKKSDDKEEQRKYDSSVARMKVIEDNFDIMKDVSTTFKLMSQRPNEDPFMNPLRKGDISKKEMVTTAQMVLVPNERVLYYRPIYSNLTFTYNKLNSQESKTFFEVVSSRKVLTFEQYLKSSRNVLIE